jgi:hypothetical protein
MNIVKFNVEFAKEQIIRRLNNLKLEFDNLLKYYHNIINMNDQALSKERPTKLNLEVEFGILYNTEDKSDVWISKNNFLKSIYNFIPDTFLKAIIGSWLHLFKYFKDERFKGQENKKKLEEYELELRKMKKEIEELRVKLEDDQKYIEELFKNNDISVIPNTPPRK